MLNQNSLNDALAAMERLTQVFPNAEGELLFSANYIVGQVHDKNRDFSEAASSYDAAITNAPWHVKSNEARVRKAMLSLKLPNQIRIMKNLYSHRQLLVKPAIAMKARWN